METAKGKMAGLLTLFILAAGVLSGCAGTAIHKGAAQGAQMTVDLDADLHTVIAAQNELYETRLDNAVLSINDLYLNTQRLYVQQEAEKFAKSNRDTTAEQMEPKILIFMDTSMKKWVKRHEDYNNLLNRAKSTFDKNTAKIEQDRSKLKALRARFVSLSNPRTREEAIKLLIAFAKDVKTDLDRRKEDLKEAAENAKASNPSQ